MAVTKESLDELSKLISCKLEKYLDKKGGILYSSHETICAGDVYLIGMNPGGEGGTAPKLSDCLLESRKNDDGNIYRQDNAYWPGTDGHHWASQLQSRVQWLLEGLVGKEKAKKVFATNLVFIQSSNKNAFYKEVGMSIQEAAKACWPVHKAFLSIVRPKLILAFGNAEGFSPYRYMRDKYIGKDKECRKTFEHGTRPLKGFHTKEIKEIPGQDVFVAGLPHFSWGPHYSSKIDDNQPVINWIKSHWTPENKQA